MDSWMWIGLAVFTLFIATSMLKTVLGLAIKYIVFVGLAGFIYRAQTDANMSFVDPEVIGVIATIGALAFVFTIGVMALLFRKSRFKLVLFPLVGFATTFAAAAMVTQTA